MKTRRLPEKMRKAMWKKGAPSPNPHGRPVLTPEQKALRRLTLQTYQEVIEMALTGNVEDLKNLAQNPNTPAIQVGVATAIMRAIKDGDPSVLERFAARIVGEIPKNLNINGICNVNNTVTIIPAEIAKRALLEIENDV